VLDAELRVSVKEESYPFFLVALTYVLTYNICSYITYIINLVLYVSASPRDAHARWFCSWPFPIALWCLLMVRKICPWDDGVCRRVSCDEILGSGLVVVCERHGNSHGRFLQRKISSVRVSAFSKHRDGGCLL